jgi:hypothetical protein
MLSRGCNIFRDECLRTCDLGEVQKKCTKKYDKGYRKGGSKKQSCKDKCEERTCWDEYRD